jgi:hypothetical protein
VQSNDGTGSAGVFGVYEIPQQALEQVNSVEKCQFHWFAQYATRYLAAKGIRHSSSETGAAMAWT